MLFFSNTNDQFEELILSTFKILDIVFDSQCKDFYLKILENLYGSFKQIHSKYIFLESLEKFSQNSSIQS